ncbi:hypothetical protein BHM03_00051448 [Ensete ventricosum]|nr:hypothetical protein BHM03_00051448 [Ensete ventricosum]
MERLHSGRGRGWKQRLCTVAKGHTDNAVVRGRGDEGSNNGCCGKGEREEQRGSGALLLLFFFLLWLQQRCVPFLFKMLAARREVTAAMRSDREAEGSGDRQLRVEGNDRQSMLGGLGCGCVATTRATARAASGGGGLHGCVEEEQRVMAVGATAGCSGRGEKEVEEAVTAAEVAGKRRRQRPTMGGNSGCEEQRVMAAGAMAGCSDRGEKEVEEAVIAVEVAGKTRKQRPTMGGNSSWRPELAAAVVKKVDGWLRLQVDCGSEWGAAR